jgi:hypothetical protein
VCVLVATLFKGGISEDETNSPRPMASAFASPKAAWLR